MRTTEDDVPAVARLRAEREHASIGRVLRAPAHAALQSTTMAVTPTTRNGLPVLPTPTGGQPVTVEVVNPLRDELP